MTSIYYHISDLKMKLFYKLSHEKILTIALEARSRLPDLDTKVAVNNK